MRREDIVVGAEYAQTAPLAYGVEPRVGATRIRWVSTDPNMRMLTEYVRGEGRSWQPRNRQFVHKSQAVAYPDAVGRVFRVAAEEGKTEIQVVERYNKGELPAEMYAHKQGDEWQWVPTMVAPAAVHRTWADHVQAHNEAVERREQAWMVRAPYSIRSQVESVLEDAIKFKGDRDEGVRYVRTVIAEVLEGRNEE